MDIATLLVALGGGGALGGVITALIGAMSGRGKSRADAAKTITESADRMLTRLDKEVSGLVSRVESLERKLEAEERRSWAAVGYIRRLIDALVSHAPHAPIPEPPELLSDVL